MPDLFTVTTDRVHLSWSGTPAAAGGATLDVEPLSGPAHATVGATERLCEGRCTLPLRLEEETAYPVLVRSCTDAAVTLYHRDPVLLNGLIAAEGGRVLHGSVRFGGYVGESRFVVLADGRPEFAFTVTVAPTKVAAADAEALRDEVEQALSGFATRFLGPTALAASVDAGPPSRPIWLTHLRSALPALERALAAVALHPRPGLHRASELVRTDRIARPDAAARRAATRAGATGLLSLPRVLPTLPSRATLDTPAHRWLRTRIEAASHRLATVQHEEACLPPAPRRDAARAELDDLAGRLRRLLRAAPLADAVGPAPPARPLLLAHAPGYAEAAHAIHLLETALALGEGAREAVPRDLGGLYEVWCYLTLGRLVAARLGVPIPEDAFFRAHPHGVHLRLRRGARHALAFVSEGRTVRLSYQPRFSSSLGLLAQRPDFLLTVEGYDAAPRLFVLDAKYRRDDSVSYRKRHGAPGPPEDALGDLHRYRDAIVTAGAGGPERPIEAAFALFPLRYDEGYESSRLWTSVKEIGVGAVPLLPGRTELLARWLDEVLG